ncbi:hypothetical protein AMTRI_Chr12g274480 [Amborella trichopoda]
MGFLSGWFLSSLDCCTRLSASSSLSLSSFSLILFNRVFLLSITPQFSDSFSLSLSLSLCRFHTPCILSRVTLLPSIPSDSHSPLLPILSLAFFYTDSILSPLFLTLYSLSRFKKING